MSTANARQMARIPSCANVGTMPGHVWKRTSDVVRVKRDLQALPAILGAELRRDPAQVAPRRFTQRPDAHSSLLAVSVMRGERQIVGGLAQVAG